MLRLYFIRHGETQYNIEFLVQGWCDSHLTEKGIMQAKKVGEALSGINFVGCFSSDLGRCQETTENILGDRKLDVTYTYKLREFHFGSFEEKTLDEFKALDDQILMKGVKEFGGEDIPDFTKRYFSALDDIKEKYSDGNVLVVSHGRAIMTLLKSIDDTIDEFPIVLGKSPVVKNCSLSIIEYDNGWKIVDYNKVLF